VSAGLLGAVAAALGGAAEAGAPLGARTTYRVGGPAALLVTATTEDDLGRVHQALVAAGGPVPVLVVGQGSNLLVADAGFPGLVVVLDGLLAAVDVPERAGTETEVAVRAGGGAKLPVVARQAAAAGLRGLEWAVGVPGSVGGAVRMNAGGHGSDMAACLVSARVADLSSGGFDDRLPEHLGLGYRSSGLEPAEVVVAAALRAWPGDRAEAEAAVSEIVRWRRANQPGGANSGSVFTNPPDGAAGRLVEEAGCKGMRVGSAEVSTKHANFIQADPGGTAADVRAVIDIPLPTVTAR
jgi:UDP-N-acetylmuramate dehydrogenase